MENIYLQFALLVGTIVLIFGVIFFVINPLTRHFAKKTSTVVDEILVEKHLISRGLQLVPAMVFTTAVSEVLDKHHWLFDACSRFSNIWFSLLTFAIACAALNVLEELNSRNVKMQHRPLHGIFQAVKVAAFCVCAIFVVSQVTDKSPVIILSALGAMATVLILVFRDSILGVVSGIQINLSDLLRKGDWIEIERHHADGTVIDITLTSVKIRNWDKTISVIPAYDLITNSFRNWRGMQEAEGRRIKRSLLIDVKSVRFLTEEDITRLSKVKILSSYLAEKQKDLACVNSECDEVWLNSRHLTNIGTFRAYCTAYLKSLSTIRQDFTLMTRQLQSTAEGLPLELYAFANTTEWIAYESIQADIFDHLISALPAFDLRLYQYGGLVK